jgi:hypothetical protein
MPSDKPAWKALLGRISIFPLMPSPTPPTPSPTPPSALDLFHKVWQIKPEEFHGQANPLMPSMAQGKLGNLTANCIKQQIRTDFNLLPSRPTDASLASIEDTTQLHQELSDIIRVIGEDLISDPVVRVAVFVQFVMPVSTLEEANKILLASMPQAYRMGVTNEEDFVFQINRPVHLNDIDNLRMNIITKWSADRIQIIVGSHVDQLPVSQQLIAASVTFDHNNVPSITPISSDKQAVLLTEGLSKVANLRRDYDMNIAGF